MTYITLPIHSALDMGSYPREAEARFYLRPLDNGVLSPGTRGVYTSAAHSAEDIDQIVDAFKKSFLAAREEGLF